MVPHRGAAKAEGRDPRGALGPEEELGQEQHARALRSAPAATQREPHDRSRVQLYQYGRLPYRPSFVPVRTPPQRYTVAAESRDSRGDNRDGRKVEPGRGAAADEPRRSRHGQRHASPSRERGRAAHSRRHGHSTRHGTRHGTRHSTGRSTMMDMNGMAVLIATCAILCCLAVMCLSFNLGVATGANRARAATRM
ncbi:hypothetical protein E2C01_089635 [Portunus trituberculatus]|uniref:Uncharacterized protein n=1 Tax=Portunus trituberculatus TaxID=210409 RepID=A0A5B7JQ44_PORTR|nr:hypothetical protein [Portunus trituberculatus]